MKNIAVLVSGGGTNLGALIEAQKDGRIKSGRIMLVLSSDPQAYALTRAADNGIKTVTVDRKKYKSRTEYTHAVTETLSSYSVDLVVLAGFMCIMAPEFTEKFENRVINVHPALTPSFCGDGYYGLHVHEAALAKGVRYSGATVHFVSEVTDGGAIILQKPVKVMQNDTPETLQKRIMVKAEQVILPRAVELFCSGRLSIKNGKVHIREK